jgi:purine-nucleoside/S-methyl-5'-thioadenosine phosphorylase / adenosine deaminase
MVRIEIPDSPPWPGVYRAGLISYPSGDASKPSRWPLPPEAIASLGLEGRTIARNTQVHGKIVRTLTETSTPDQLNMYPDADALISNRDDIVLAVNVADCAPILLADPVVGACAAVHAGWRGTAANIVDAAVVGMHESFGSDPNNIIAWIGPCIKQPNYAVGEEVYKTFCQLLPQMNMDDYFSGQDYRVDIAGINQRELQLAGLLEENILVSPLCSYAELELESYRRDGDGSGRMVAVIARASGVCA